MSKREGTNKSRVLRQLVKVNAARPEARLTAADFAPWWPDLTERQIRSALSHLFDSYGTEDPTADGLHRERAGRYFAYWWHGGAEALGRPSLRKAQAAEPPAHVQQLLEPAPDRPAGRICPLIYTGAMSMLRETTPVLDALACLEARCAWWASDRCAIVAGTDHTLWISRLPEPVEVSHD